MTRSRDALGGGGWKHLQLAVDVMLIHWITKRGKKMLSQVENSQSRRHHVTAEQEAEAQTFESKSPKFKDSDQRMVVPPRPPAEGGTYFTDQVPRCDLCWVSRMGCVYTAAPSLTVTLCSSWQPSSCQPAVSDCTGAPANKTTVKASFQPDGDTHVCYS